MLTNMHGRITVKVCITEHCDRRISMQSETGPLKNVHACAADVGHFLHL